MYSAFACQTSKCGATYTVPYAPVALTLGPSVPAPINASPYLVAAPCTRSAMLTFTGFLEQDIDGETTVVASVYLQYYNVAVPSVLVQQTVPVVATLPPGYNVPVTACVTATLPAGTYGVQVMLTADVLGAVVQASGTLNVDMLT